MSMLDKVQQTGDDPRALTWIIFGEPKVGKTTLAATFPDPLLIDIEGGSAFVRVPQFPLRSLITREKSAHAMLQELYAELKTSNTYKTIIFDTLDELWEVLAKPYKKEGKLPLPAYQPLYETVLSLIDGYRALGLDVVFTSHVKHEMDEDGRPVATDIKLPGQLQAKIAAKADEILYLTVERKKKDESGEDSKANTRQARVLVCKPTDHPKLGTIRAGDRSGQLPDIIVDPTYADLSVAKNFVPGLFDGMGDPQ